MATSSFTKNHTGGPDMTTPYFNDFVSYSERIEQAKAFTINVFLREKSETAPSNSLVVSSAIPNKPELLEAVLQAVAASTVGDMREPLILWTGHAVEIIPPESIEHVRLSFAP
jgi:hypothetical protein